MKRTAVFVWSLILLFCVPYAAGAEESRWAAFEGNKIHFLDSGRRNEKNAIVLIHGWMCNSDFWSESIGAFPNKRVIAIDLIGHGKSDKPEIAYTMDLFARSVAAVLKEAGVDRAVLVGHSMGTPVARQFYRLHPERVLGIVIVDGSLRPYFTKESGEQTISAFRADYSAASNGFVNGMIKPIANKALKKKIADAMLSGPMHVGVSALDSLRDESLWKADPIKVPVLSIYDDSAGWPVDTEGFIRSLAPTLDFQSWKGVSHFLMMERPTEFNGQLKMFIAKHKLL